MRIRKHIFRLATDIEQEISEKIGGLLRSKGPSFADFRSRALLVMEGLEAAAKCNEVPSGDFSAAYSRLSQLAGELESLERGYHKFQDYFEFFKAFQIDLKFGEAELLGCFKVAPRDAGGLLKRNLEEQSQLWAETISNMSNRDEMASQLDESMVVLDQRQTILTPMSSTVHKDAAKTASNFFSSPRPPTFNFLRSSTNLGSSMTQLTNPRSFLRASTLDDRTGGFESPSPSPVLHLKQDNFASFKKPQAEIPPINLTRSISRKPSGNSTIAPQTPAMRDPLRSSSILSEQELDLRQFNSLRKSTAFFPKPQPTTPSHGPIPAPSAEQIANLSNLVIDSTKFRKIVLTITSCYKAITRINFRSNVFECDPLELLLEIFARPLPQLFTIDLRRNRVPEMGDNFKEAVGRLLLHNLKVIV